VAPSARLDPDCGRRHSAAVESRPFQDQIPPIQVSTASWDCQLQQPGAGLRRLTDLLHHRCPAQCKRNTDRHNHLWQCQEDPLQQRQPRQEWDGALLTPPEALGKEELLKSFQGRRGLPDGARVGCGYRALLLRQALLASSGRGPRPGRTMSAKLVTAGRLNDQYRHRGTQRGSRARRLP
jgi:hypothetical protein